MSEYISLFRSPGQPADSVRIAEIERALGKILPEDYKTLLAQTGGGSLKPNHSFISGITLPSGEELYIAADTLFGNGKTANGLNIDMIDYGIFLMDEWEIPNEVLLLATTSDGMHQCFVINYGLTDFPAGSVLHFDTDPEGQMTQVADSVDDFLSRLGPDPSATPARVDIPAHTGIIGARQGPLSQALRQAISQTPTPDIEQLLRTSAEPLAKTASLSISVDSAETRRFLDVLYWATQHVAPQTDPQTFVHPENDDAPFSLHKLISESFVNPGLGWPSTYSYFPIGAWWKSRVEEGVLKKTPDGYLLDEDYITGVLEEMQEEEK